MCKDMQNAFLLSQFLYFRVADVHLPHSMKAAVKVWAVKRQ